ncbi:MAG: hypothetical protein IE881_05135 [Epsilonproteobacteria bacterium]|nr:hypothetical protein [Campylobacterota bacterium]
MYNQLGKTNAKKTKVVITIGPTTSTTQKIKELIELGVDVFRINFSHGDYTEHTQIIKKNSANFNTTQ